jgi:predicted Zn-dependent peptidase
LGLFRCQSWRAGHTKGQFSSPDVEEFDALGSIVLTFAPMAQRKKAPIIQAITELHLPPYESITLPNGMPLYMVKGSAEPVMKMEIVFRAGAAYEKKPVAAEVMAGLLSEGTKTLDSAALAEKIESLGATVFTRGGVDTIRVRLLTLTKFFPDLIEVIKEIVDKPAFDPGELQVLVENKVERLKIDLKKNEVLAYRHLTEKIFGPDHPYGKNNDPEDYEAITAEELEAHHRNYILPQHGMIFISGHFGEKEIALIRETIGRWDPGYRNGKEDLPPLPKETNAGDYVYDGPQAHQAAIRIGRRLFPQSHPDFIGLYMLNTILGGYFGSRLMMEIRENQGLTYGIYSSVDSFASDGCFYISTEAATENADKVIEAIKTEMKRLQMELIPESELDMARNYLMGHLMTQIDGPFSTMDLIKSFKIENLDDNMFAKTIDMIQQITPKELQELARKYLDVEKWVIIVVK